MMWHWGEFGGWGMGFGFLFMALFWGLVIVGIVALVRWLVREPHAGRAADGRTAPARDKTPLEIVQERYARGDISREEFEQKRQDLQG